MRRALVLIVVAVLAAACSKKQAAAPKSPPPDTTEPGKATGGAEEADKNAEPAPAKRTDDPCQGGEDARKKP
jgi:hypothetical protein